MVYYIYYGVPCFLVLKICYGDFPSQYIQIHHNIFNGCKIFHKMNNHSYHHLTFPNSWTFTMDPGTHTSCPLISVTQIPRSGAGQMKHFQMFKI